MEHSAQADFHGGLGRKGAWRLPFVFYTCAQNFRQKKTPPGAPRPGVFAFELLPTYLVRSINFRRYSSLLAAEPSTKTPSLNDAKKGKLLTPAALRAPSLCSAFTSKNNTSLCSSSLLTRLYLGANILQAPHQSAWYFTTTRLLFFTN